MAVPPLSPSGPVPDPGSHPDQALTAGLLASVMVSSTSEMMAELPDGLMLSEGATVAERRVTDVLALYRAVFLNSADPIATFRRAGSRVVKW